MMPASRHAEHLLDILNVLLSDVRYGLGAYLGVYLLSEHRWDEASIGLALSAGGVARLISPTPMGALVDAGRDKRWLVAFSFVVVAAARLSLLFGPRLCPLVSPRLLG